MAIKTVTNQRFRTEIKTFSEANISDLETAFSSFESAQAADETKTITVKPLAAGFDGAEYFVIAEVYWPEINEDPLGQVPELTPP